MAEDLPQCILCSTKGDAPVKRGMVWIVLFVAVAAHGEAPVVAFEMRDLSLDIRVDDALFATYVWRDDDIPRPYFKSVHAPGGAQITRNYPTDPVADRGNEDHATYHPGIWMAFGDINGEDFWRLKARVVHVAFSDAPKGGTGTGSFEVQNHYERLDGTLVCEERCRYTLHVTERGYLLLSESTFSNSDHAFTFGDQEEMGFGLRFATPITVKHGNGALKNSSGGENEAGTWGQRADWCAGYGELDGEIVGAMIMLDPANFRPSWFHSRDYGLVVANPFGKKAMTAPDDESVPADATTVAAGEELNLGFGIYVFRGEPDFDGVYRAYLGRVNTVP